MLRATPHPMTRGQDPLFTRESPGTVKGLFITHGNHEELAIQDEKEFVSLVVLMPMVVVPIIVNSGEPPFVRY